MSVPLAPAIKREKGVADWLTEATKKAGDHTPANTEKGVVNRVSGNKGKCFGGKKSESVASKVLLSRPPSPPLSPFP